MSDNAALSRFFAGIDAEKTAALSRFRQQNPQFSLQVNRHTWRYYDCGTGDDTVLILPGSGGDAEMMFRYIDGFTDSFRVIAPDLPPTVTELPDIISGIAAILADRQISRVHVFGLSFGAALAQLLMRRLSRAVDDVVLVHAALPDEQIAARIRMQQGFFRLYPAPLLRWILQRSMHRAIESAPFHTDPAERRFWQACYADLYHQRFSKYDWLTRAALSHAYYHSEPFQNTDLDHWKGRILIIESDMDEVIDEGQRGALKALYPSAFVQTLSGYSHLAGVLAWDKILSSAHKFLLLG